MRGALAPQPRSNTKSQAASSPKAGAASVRPIALDGVTVIDLAQFESGSVATQALAWLGADVIKVEKPSVGDPVRRATRDRPWIDSPGFLLFNSNKRSVTINLKHPKGQSLLRLLLSKADVVVENFRPGTLEQLGLDYESVAALNPGLIYAQIKGFGHGSPFEHYPAFDPIGQAAGGSMSLTGMSDGPPLRPGVNLADSGAGMHAVIGIVAALYQRTRTGRGQKVEIAMQDAVINLSRSAYGKWLSSGEESARVGNDLHIGISAPSNAYPCKPFGPNDFCYIHCSRSGNDDWQRLLAVIGRNDLIDDPRFATPEQRWENKDFIDDMLGKWTSERNKFEAMAELGSASVPASAVLSTRELATDESLRARGIFATVTHPDRGEIVVPGWPVIMTESRVEVRAAPRLGDGNHSVLHQLLGLSDEELIQLGEEGAI